MTARANARDKILDAAELIVRERGATAITMDALAYMTGVGKGGVLYHFKLKSDLYRAMLERYTDRLIEPLHLDASKASEDKYEWLEHFVDFCLHKDELAMTSAISIIAAASESPELLEPLRKTYKKRLDRAIANMPDPEMVAIIMLALDGLITFSTISAPPIDDSMREGIYNRMIELIQDMKKLDADSKKQKK